MKYTILVDLSLVIVNIYFYALEFQEIHKFYTFYPKIFSPWSEGVMKFRISCLLILLIQYTKFGKDWSSSS